MHATAVALGGNGLLILGASGAGKSSFALDMIALGAELIADDLVELTLVDGRLHAAPVRHHGVIEAHGIGILKVPPAQAPHKIDFVLDLGVEETERLPQQHSRRLLGIDIICLHRPNRLSASAMTTMMRAGGTLNQKGFI